MKIMFFSPLQTPATENASSSNRVGKYPKEDRDSLYSVPPHSYRCVKFGEAATSASSEDNDSGIAVCGSVDETGRFGINFF